MPGAHHLQLRAKPPLEKRCFDLQEIRNRLLRTLHLEVLAVSRSLVPLKISSSAGVAVSKKVTLLGLGCAASSPNRPAKLKNKK